MYRNAKSGMRVSDDRVLDTSHISRVSLWVAEGYPMTRHLIQHYEALVSDRALAGSIAAVEGRQVVPVPAVWTFALLANIVCSMVTRRVPPLFTGDDSAAGLAYYMKVGGIPLYVWTTG